MAGDSATGAALATGILLGLGAAVPIGPVNIEIARRTLRQGFSAGVAVGLGACFVDMVYAVAVSAGVARLAESPWVKWPLTVGGIALLLYLARGCFAAERLDARRGWAAVDKTPAADAGARAERGGRLASDRSGGLVSGLATGLGMTLLNPMTLAFWFVAMPAAVVAGVGKDGAALWPVAGGVFIGTLSWVVVFSSILALIGRWRAPWWMALADYIGGVLLAGFAALAFLRCLR